MYGVVESFGMRITMTLPYHENVVDVIKQVNMLLIMVSVLKWC